MKIVNYLLTEVGGDNIAVIRRDKHDEQAFIDSLSKAIAQHYVIEGEIEFFYEKNAVRHDGVICEFTAKWIYEGEEIETDFVLSEIKVY